MAHTIKDVSRLSGVSTATVSRTFSNPDSVKKATRDKVMEAARILNYEPNAIARSMKLQQTEKIAFLICKAYGSILDEFYAGICDGIMQATNRSDYQLLVSTERDWTSMKRNQVDGVILGGNASLKLIQECNRLDMKIVLVNNEVGGFDFPCVVADEEMAVRLGVEHLISRGHTRIGMLAGRFSQYVCERRYNAFKSVMEEKGLPILPGHVMITDPDLAASTDAAVTMMTQAEPPTAILAANDEIATGTMKAAIRLGRRVPDDIAILGIDDSRVCTALEPELTSVHIFRDQMGVQSAKMLLALLQGKEPEEKRLVIKPELIIRKST